MRTWTLQLKHAVDAAVDARSIQIARFQRLDLAQIEAVTLSVDGLDVPLGDLFDVSQHQTSRPAAAASEVGRDRIVMQGDLASFHHLGSSHRGGELWIDGNVGDFLAAAAGASRVGMTGGRIVVTGDVGHYAGHRMRRGEIWVAGDAGRLTAAHMIAGTVVVGGRVGGDAALAMRRGSLVVSTELPVAEGRFTDAVESSYLFASLVNVPAVETLRTFWDRLRVAGCQVRRGDRAVGGQGEIVAVMAEG